MSDTLYSLKYWEAFASEFPEKLILVISISQLWNIQKYMILKKLIVFVNKLKNIIKK